uniref:Uncharacterized protein n=1 Tax=Kalanchoe fedtschenkoi TaxID=63787 RepID=A0A7N0T8N0_KALFE
MFSGSIVLTFNTFNGSVRTNISFKIYDVISRILTEMGLIKKSRLGTFNLPCHHASSKQIIKAIFQEGSFEIRRLEIKKTAWNGGTDDEDERASDKNRARGKLVVKYIRAVLKALLVAGFGEGVLDELFGRASVKFTKLMNAQDCQFHNIVVWQTRN